MMILRSNKDEAIKNKIKILATLQDIRAPFGFNEIMDFADLNPHILNKWLKRFDDDGMVERVGERDRKKYQITDKGKSEYKRLIAQDNAKKIFSKGDLIDSTSSKKDISINDKRLSCEVITSISAVIPNEKKRAIEKGFNEKIIPQIIKLYKEQGIDNLSGAALLSFSPKEATLSNKKR